MFIKIVTCPPLTLFFFRGLAREPLEGNGKYQNMISHDIM